MNQINGIGSYGGLERIEPRQGASVQGGQTSEASGKKEDQVEISSTARFLSAAAQMPEIRADKVEQIRQQLLDGTYDIEGKLPAALEALLNEHAG